MISLKRILSILFFIVLPLAVVCTQEKKSLKILFVLSYFPESVSTAILNQITGLIDRGHNVIIYAKKIGNTKHAHPDIIRYNLIDRAYFHARNHLNNLPPDLHTFDIICCQFGYRATEFVEVYKKKKLTAKFVTCFRGSDLSKHIEKNPKIYNQLFKIGDLFLPVCNFFRKKLIKLGCSPRKIIVQYSSTDCKKFSFKERVLEPDNTIKIITVARLTEKKGLDYAIKAMKQLSIKFPHIVYQIVGTGPLKRKLEQLIKKLGMQNKIKLVGWASQDEVVTLLNESHIFIHPSITDYKGSQEGIPNALKEAMAQGMPVVSTFHSGIPELVEDGVSGFLVPERDTTTLAQKIGYLIRNPSIWKKMGIAARQKIKNNFSKEATNDKLVKIFQNLLHKKSFHRNNRKSLDYAWFAIN